eukprot:scaffold241417_cov21-Tisochrysis_lutea.AAC.1
MPSLQVRHFYLACWRACLQPCLRGNLCAERRSSSEGKPESTPESTTPATFKAQTLCAAALYEAKSMSTTVVHGSVCAVLCGAALYEAHFKAQQQQLSNHKLWGVRPIFSRDGFAISVQWGWQSLCNGAISVQRSDLCAAWNTLCSVNGNLCAVEQFLCSVDGNLCAVWMAISVRCGRQSLCGVHGNLCAVSILRDGEVFKEARP